MSDFEYMIHYGSAVDPLNPDGAVIYSNTRFVPKIVPWGSNKFEMVLFSGIGSECMPLSQNHLNFVRISHYTLFKSFRAFKKTAQDHLRYFIDSYSTQIN